MLAKKMLKDELVRRAGAHRTNRDPTDEPDEQDECQVARPAAAQTGSEPVPRNARESSIHGASHSRSLATASACLVVGGVIAKAATPPMTSW